MSNRQAREARPVRNLANFGILALEFTTEEWIAPPGPADQPAAQRGHGQAGHRPPQECVVDSTDLGIGKQVRGEAGPLVWLRTNSQRKRACHKPLATATGVVPNSHGECGVNHPGIDGGSVLSGGGRDGPIFKAPS